MPPPQEELKEFRIVWAAAVDATSDAQIANIHRGLATTAKAEAEQTAKRQAQAREDAALRALFREKNP